MSGMPETTSRQDAGVEPEPRAELELLHSMQNVEVSLETAPPRRDDMNDVDMAEFEVFAFFVKCNMTPEPLRQHRITDTKQLCAQ